MKKRGMSKWDFLSWVALIGILIWVILKVFGVINTPLWLEYAPIYGAVYIAGWAMNKLQRTTQDVKDIKEDIKEIDKDIGTIKRTCPNFKT